MTRYTPSAHLVFNDLDRHGLLLGLPRLENERNAAYKQRIMDVLVNRADSTYRGLINGITRELGLSLREVMTITPNKTGESFSLTMPAIVFEETKCYLYSDYGSGTLLSTIDRYDTDGGAWTLTELVSTINATGYYTAVLESGVDGDTRSMTIFNQQSVHIVPYEPLSGTGIVANLGNRNIIQGTVSIRSDNLINRVASTLYISDAGDYYVDHLRGIVYSAVAPAPGDIIRYEYTDETFVVRASPVIIHNLQSTDFISKMFEQVIDEDGTSVNGLPNALGASIINELLSVYPISWGE